MYFMRRKFLYVAALFAVISTSCSSDDDNKSASSSLVGKWEYSKEGVIDDGIEHIDEYNHQCASKKDYVEYLGGDQATIMHYDSACEEDRTTATYVYANNKITMTIGGVSAEVQVVELSGTTLKIKEESSPGYGEVYVMKKVK